MRVGIPRALLYYQYLPAWKTFFEVLGADVIVSPPTTQVMLAEGSSRVVADTCLPVKVYLGHAAWLADKCDRVFVPAIRSVERKVYNCSKFLGLPDMTKAVIPELPGILEIEIDVNAGKNRLYRDMYLLGRHLDGNPLKVKRAAEEAWQSLLVFREMMCREKSTPVEAVGRMHPDIDQGKTTGTPVPDRFRGRVAVIGHPYMIYDEYINHRLINRIKKTGNAVVTPEMVSYEEQQHATRKVTGGAYWTYENEVAGAGGYYLEDRVDGVIGVMAFGCGPDSLMMDMVRRYSVHLGSVPFMCLTMEEHTAEAGVITRIEAFTDMIYRRKRADLDICVSESLI